MPQAGNGAMLRYCLTAGALGAGWFPVLLVPAATRAWLLSDVPQGLGCLVAASVVVAVACRRFIGGAGTLREHLVRAALLPYLGCLVFLGMCVGLMWARTLLFGGLANLHDSLSLFVMGTTAAALSCYVVVPYGLLCQYVMSTVARSGSPDARHVTAPRPPR